MIRTIVSLCLLLACMARDAQAQMSMGSFTGHLTGHVGSVTEGDVSGAKTAGGASVSVNEQNGWGAELDAAFARDVRVAGPRLDLTSYMVNASWIAPRPMGRLHPFVVLGAGILQVTGCECARKTARTNDLALSVGGGVLASLNDMFGARGDVRYIHAGGTHRDLGRPDGLSYVRVSLGVTVSWAILP